ncbi:WbuC family cupin fold metalloprotein [Pantoea sp. JK]|uniref:WbuC family cupin fold metalloprotein n=1 Tax=Pantoea sp. JK TaxID=2871703 RepID=UPI002238B3D7|nr:WbuC family cupin fold metalloprotein [Pantoea sp. JK]MCW6033893.1 WbuC family cupin fold metalloprotein [Pantoea sp. JK]
MRLIDDAMIQSLFDSAVSSERKRSHILLHNSQQDKVQRLLIGLVQGSYVEPHYHELPHQWELFTVLEGVLEITLYNENGEILSKFNAGPTSNTKFIEFAPGDIHSVECISERALMLEVKEGPFDDKFAKAFPQWNCG